MAFIRTVLIILKKDIVLELKSREIVPSMALFSLLAVVLFHLSMGDGLGRMTQASAGVLWITFVFAGVLGLNKSFVQEKENNCMDALMIGPVGPDAVFAGKMLANFIFITLVETATLAVFAILFRIESLSVLFPVMIVIGVNTLGFCSVGTILAAIAVNTKNREVLLPVLLYPIIVPLVISGAKSTAMLMDGAAITEVMNWIKLSAAFDAIYIVVPMMIFSYVVKE